MTNERRFPHTVGIVIALVTGGAAIIASIVLGIPLKDPEGFLGPAYVRLPLMALSLFAVGLLIDGYRRRGFRQLPLGMRESVQKEWNAKRVIYVVIGMAVFYASYVGYRNLKSDLPVLREDVLYDAELLEFDKLLGFGVDPAVIMHDVLGTGWVAEFLSAVYLAYMPLIPITLAAFLILNKNITIGAWYSTALAVNWSLGVVSYYLIPALGPVYHRPDLFSDLPETGVSGLQDSLMSNRLIFLADPENTDKIHGVAAFASLHTSVTFTAALFCSKAAQGLMARIVSWGFFVATAMATVYFGWHYVSDVIAGMLIGWAAVALGAWSSGNWKMYKRKRKDPGDFDPLTEPSKANLKASAAEVPSQSKAVTDDNEDAVLTGANSVLTTDERRDQS